MLGKTWHVLCSWHWTHCVHRAGKTVFDVCFEARKETPTFETMEANSFCTKTKKFKKFRNKADYVFVQFSQLANYLAHLSVECAETGFHLKAFIFSKFSGVVWAGWTGCWTLTVFGRPRPLSRPVRHSTPATNIYTFYVIIYILWIFNFSTNCFTPNAPNFNSKQVTIVTGSREHRDRQVHAQVELSSKFVR